MKALVARLTGKIHQDDPINIHITVFWATIVFWAVAATSFALVKAFS
jgi:hypothetical protein